MAKRRKQLKTDNRRGKVPVGVIAAVITAVALILSTLIPSLLDKFPRTPTPTETPTITPLAASTNTLVTSPTFTPSPTETSTPTISTTLCPVSTTDLPRNAELTKCAWDFFNVGMYDHSIVVADECIDQFEGEALRQQQEFSASGNPTPPTGEPPNDSIKNETLARGPLNDVATCYFIKGSSLEKLNRKSDAKEAYMGAQKFQDARTWDPRGYFWSPSQAAIDQIDNLP